MAGTTTCDGSTFDEFLHEEGLCEEVTRSAAARVLAWQNGFTTVAFPMTSTDQTQEAPTDDCSKQSSA